MRSVANRRRHGVVRSWAPYLLFAAGLFLVMAVLGAAVGTERSATILPIRPSGDPVTDRGFAYFFVRNGVVALLMAGGSVLGGLPTAGLLGYNGFLLGGVTADAAGTYGLGRTLLLLLPHGVFELPAFWLAGAIGFRTTHVGWRTATGRGTDTPIPAHLLQAAVALAVVVVLLSVAAFVEAAVTLPLADALT